MKIDSISIRNFRGFEEKTFTLNQSFTVAIGNNGLGKSTLLCAIQVGLGAFLQSMPTLPANYIYRRQFKPTERLIKFDEARKDFLPNKEVPYVKVSAYTNNSKDSINRIEWLREYLWSNSTTHKAAHSAKVIEYANYLFDNHDKDVSLLYPVFANFQINRTNAQVKKVDKSFKRLSKLAKGYYAALGDSIDFTGVYEWLSSYKNKIRDGQEFEGTKEAMLKAILEAIPYIAEIEYNVDYKEFEVVVDYGDSQPKERKLASLLSDGMRAMLYVVAEIAYRCIMLNGKLGIKAISESPGIVLIDELDMHLHPKWQRHVVSDLKRAFPNIQFVVTTHSPFIVQSLKSEELINLDENENIGLEEDPSKYSLEEVTSQEMGVENVERSETFLQMQKDAKEYFDLIKSGDSKQNIQKAKEKLDALRIKYNNDPAYVAFLQSSLPSAEK